VRGRCRDSEVGGINLKPSGKGPSSQPSPAWDKKERAAAERIEITTKKLNQSGGGNRRAGLGRYSMTSSARPSSDSGTVMPSVFAVFRLTIISTRVAC
jgi:hypothetical protein